MFFIGVLAIFFAKIPAHAASEYLAAQTAGSERSEHCATFLGLESNTLGASSSNSTAEYIRRITALAMDMRIIGPAELSRIADSPIPINVVSRSRTDLLAHSEKIDDLLKK